MPKPQKKVKKISGVDILKMYSANREVKYTSTGLPFLDELWGGGIDKQGTYAMWGPQGCGKSTICFQIIKEYCKNGRTVIFVDVEKALNEKQQIAFGLKGFVDSGLLIHVTINNYEEFEKIIDAAVDIKPALFIVDSETMLLPVVARELTVLDAQPGIKAKQASYCLSKMKSLFFYACIPSIILFHARAKITMKGGQQDDIKQAGGYAALHIPDVITKLEIGARVKEGSAQDAPIIGVICRFMCEKNKYTAPFIKVEKKLIFGTGISKRIDLIDTALELSIIKAGLNKEGKPSGYYTLSDGTSIRGTKALYELPSETLREIQKLVQAQ